MEIRYVSDVLKETNGLTWLDRLTGRRPDPHNDNGVVLLDDNMEFIGVFPDRVIAERVRHALELLEASEDADSMLAQMKRIVEDGI